MRFGMIATCLSLLAHPVVSQTVAPDDLKFAAEQIGQVDGIDRLMQSCPNDIRYERGSWLRRLIRPTAVWPRDVCAQNMPACAKACVKDQQPDACWSVAYLMETPEIGAQIMGSRQAYALSCALGNASGCTNRAAGIRNSPMDGDPISMDPTPETIACLKDSFQGSCIDGDAWGCAMTAQAYFYGDGVPAEPQIARTYAHKACGMSRNESGQDTAAAPCRFAQHFLTD